MVYVVLCDVGFTGSGRSYIRKLVEEGLGSKYRGDLVLGSDDEYCPRTTHLVYKDLEPARHTEKFIQALQHSIPVVPVSWVEDCVRDRKILDHRNYAVYFSLSGEDNNTRPGAPPHSPERLRAATATESSVTTTFLKQQGLSDPPQHRIANEHEESHNDMLQRPPTPDSFQRDSSTHGKPSCHGAVGRRTGSSCRRSGFPASFCAIQTNDHDQSDYVQNNTALALGLSPSLSNHFKGSDTMPSIRVSCPLKNIRNSTAGPYHGCKNSTLRFYGHLEVTSSSESRFVFDAANPLHGALLYYDDCGSDQIELAYSKIIHIYMTPDKEVWIEHEYMFDFDDVKNHPRGPRFLSSYDMQPVELIQGRDRYHSPAVVIEGEFWLTQSLQAAQQHPANPTGDSSLFYYNPSKFWNRNGSSSRMRRC
eukprot:jgi/Botrbrau1/3107/Bobra.0070s0088.2